MDLVLRELKNQAYQEISVLRDCNLVNIRPHLLKYGNPSGQVKIQLQDANGFLIDESNAVNISAMSVLDYAHGYLKFDITTPLKKGLNYRINVVAFNGYTFSSTDFVAICRDFDLRKVTANFSPNEGFNSAFDIELWERKMSDREVEFFDGFESAAKPQAGLVTSTTMNSFVNDAAFVTFKGSAAAEGDFYRNSTSGLIRYYDGIKWINVSFQDVGETQQNLVDNAGPLDVVGMVHSSAEVRDAIWAYSMIRRNDSVEKTQTGIIKMKFKPDANDWFLVRESDFEEDLGVTFTPTSSGQVKYATNALAPSDSGYQSFILFKTIKTFKPGV